MVKKGTTTNSNLSNFNTSRNILVMNRFRPLNKKEIEISE